MDCVRRYKRTRQSPEERRLLSPRIQKKSLGQTKRCVHGKQLGNVHAFEIEQKKSMSKGRRKDEVETEKRQK